MRHEVLGPRHPDTLETMGNLAVTRRKLGKHAAAEETQRDVLALRHEVLGPRHPKTLKTMGSLAVTLGELGKHTEAEAMRRERDAGVKE